MRIDLEYLQDLEDPGYAQEMRVYLAAKYYTSIGIPVVPLRPNRKILPTKDRGVSYHQAATNPKTIEKWFNPEDGEFRGWNIGLGCGRKNGIFVVDIDVKDSGNGFDSLSELAKEGLELPTTATQQTPGGGRHYLFMWQENCMGSTGKIAKYIDTRGGDEMNVKSHVVAFPSVVGTKMYKWLRGGEIADVPQWVMEKLGVPWRARQRAVGDPRGSEEVDDEDIERQVPLDQIRMMLDYVNPNLLQYEEWLAIGQSIHTQHPKDGLEVWDQWSLKGDRYKSGECHKRWHGFNESGPVRIGTLFYYCRAGGWSPRPSDTVTTPQDDVVAELNMIHGLVQIEGNIRIIRTKDAKAHLNASNFDLLTEGAFKSLYSNTKVMVINPQTGKAAYKTKAEIWLAHHHRREYVEGIGLFPGQECPPGFYNTWEGFAVTPIKSDVGPFLRHVDSIVCSGNAKLTSWVLDWLAHAVQYPDELVGTAIVMRGREGAGKGLFADTFGKLWGPHYIHMIDEHHLTSNFNRHLMNAVIVFADEVVWGGNKKTASKLKGVVTEDFMLYEIKGLDAFPGKNHVHLIMATNEKWAVPAGAHSRRWLVLDVDDAKRRDMNHWDEFTKWRDNGGYEALLYYLMYTHKVSRDAPHLRQAPETRAVAEQREMFQLSDPLVRWWMDILSNEETTQWNQVNTDGTIDLEYTGWVRRADKKSVYDSYVTWHNNNRGPYDNTTSIQFFRQLSEWGVQSKKSQRCSKEGPDGVKRYFVLIPPIEECISKFKDATGIIID